MYILALMGQLPDLSFSQQGGKGLSNHHKIRYPPRPLEKGCVILQPSFQGKGSGWLITSHPELSILTPRHSCWCLVL